MTTIIVEIVSQREYKVNIITHSNLRAHIANSQFSVIIIFTLNNICSDGDIFD